ncbi:exopolygalacturonase-like [Malus sylvestris]|uniref:exopolygalacturonase-like n=1 Tax=Malus sylvestris TaxID=3752 RepID=UPI0021ACF492|nr:exopolygalacturonase-like [Malus sylvestris]
MVGYWAFVFLFLASIANAKAEVFYVTNSTYGGNPSGDITLALADAWRDACSSPWPAKVVIPEGEYYLRGAILHGPCKSPIEVQVQGYLRAPQESSQLLQQNTWVGFQYVDRLTLFGGGTFDGQSNCHKYKSCQSNRVFNLRFDFVTNSVIEGITSLDSKNFHINVFACRNVTFQYVTITAPEDSVNTDGIHIGRSFGVTIDHTIIGTGDDCISLGDGSQNIVVTDVTCGPGHGISIGSLGKYPDEEPVVGVRVKNCTLTNTQNGVRIKTWPGSPTFTTASHIHFQEITMVNVSNPISIDQEYCPYTYCGKDDPSKVKISDISFTNIKGSSATPVAVKLMCSRKIPCDGVGLTDVDLTYIGSKGPLTSQCAYVKPYISRVANALACATWSYSNSLRSGRNLTNLLTR